MKQELAELICQSYCIAQDMRATGIDEMVFDFSKDELDLIEEFRKSTGTETEISLCMDGSQTIDILKDGELILNLKVCYPSLGHRFIRLTPYLLGVKKINDSKNVEQFELWEEMKLIFKKRL